MDDDRGDVRQFTMTVEVPGDWPPEMCKAHLAVKALDGVDLRTYRHQPQVRNSLWVARRAALAVFRDMRTVWKQGDSFKQKKS